MPPQGAARADLVSYQTLATYRELFSSALHYNLLRRGERFPGDHPLVRRRPEFFLPDGPNLEARISERLTESIGAARGRNG